MSKSEFEADDSPSVYVEDVADLLSQAVFDDSIGFYKDSEICAVSAQPFEVDDDHFGVVITCVAFGHVESGLIGLPLFIGPIDNESFDRIVFLDDHGQVTLKGLKRSRYRVWTSVFKGPALEVPASVGKADPQPRAYRGANANLPQVRAWPVYIRGSRLFVRLVLEPTGAFTVHCETGDIGLANAWIRWALVATGNEILSTGTKPLTYQKGTEKSPLDPKLPLGGKIWSADWSGAVEPQGCNMHIGIGQEKKPA